MIERRSNRRARNGRKTPKNVLFVFQNCTFRFTDYTYAQIADYDFEFGGKGRQSDGVSFGAGLSYGYSLAVGRHLNIDFTIGMGWFGGAYHKYLPVDDCFVWQSTVRQHWFGPTKAEISLVYVFGKKGGRR